MSAVWLIELPFQSPADNMFNVVYNFDREVSQLQQTIKEAICDYVMFCNLQWTHAALTIIVYVRKEKKIKKIPETL